MWDKHSATTYLRQHAQLHSTGNCAAYVRRAIDAGGIHLTPTHFARNYDTNLRMAGFVEVINPHTPMAGDVVIIQPITGHPDGHMAMYDGFIWISDFKQQHGLYPSEGYRTVAPPYKIYRHQ